MEISKIIQATLMAGTFLNAGAALGAPADPIQTGAVDEIIVTGTRTSDQTAIQSAAPIKIISSEMLTRVGQPNLNQTLSLLVPSLNAETFGGDTAAFTLSAKLRGLSPNHALVLVNGKRRHPTSNLHAVGGLFQGGAAPDLDLIPQGAIKRVEVLEDGAAAQYGSDAIGGVINILLRDDNDGVSGFATAGQHYKKDGDTYAGSVTLGQKLGDNGSLTFTLFHRYHGHTQRGGADARYYDANGNILASLSPALQAFYSSVRGRPNINRTRGGAQSYLTTAVANAQYDFGGVEVYAFGSYGRRVGESFQNWRGPDRVVRSATLGVPGVFGAPGAIAFAPNGFNPKEALEEEDYALTAGIRGEVAGWRWDISSTYGRDRADISTINSANASLFVDTGFTPTEFYDGDAAHNNRMNRLMQGVARQVSLDPGDGMEL